MKPDRMIIFLYLPSTYINSSDVGVNANTEEFLGQGRGIRAESRRRGKSNAHLYCSYIAEFPGIFPFRGQSFNWPLGCILCNLFVSTLFVSRYLHMTNAYARIYERVQSLSRHDNVFARSESVARDFARFMTRSVTLMSFQAIFDSTRAEYKLKRSQFIEREHAHVDITHFCPIYIWTRILCGWNAIIVKYCKLTNCCEYIIEILKLFMYDVYLALRIAREVTERFTSNL